MKDFRFHIPTEIVFGRHAEEEAGRMTSVLGKRALILYGSERIRKNGLLGRIERLLEENGVFYETFGGITENPLLSVAEKICGIVREKKFDVLLAVGGGSVIDTAKAVSIGSCTETPLWDFYEQKAVPKETLPVGVVLTMAATASEANCTSVITNDRINKKSVMGCPLTFPKFALMDPELTFTVPREQTAVGAVDIFSHAFERYFHLGQKGTLRRHLCTAVMKTVLEELPKAQEQPDDYESRSQLMWAATMAHSDMIGADGVFACHEMSHILTEEFGLPHGTALAVLMPAWCKYMLSGHVSEIAEFARDVWDVVSEEESDKKADEQAEEHAAQEGISRFQQFIASSGLPVTLHEAGIVQADSRELAEKTVSETGYLGEGFEKLYRRDLQAIYELAKG